MKDHKIKIHNRSKREAGQGISQSLGFVSSSGECLDPKHETSAGSKATQKSHSVAGSCQSIPVASLSNISRDTSQRYLQGIQLLVIGAKSSKRSRWASFPISLGDIANPSVGLPKFVYEASPNYPVLCEVNSQMGLLKQWQIAHSCELCRHNSERWRHNSTQLKR